MNPLPPVMIRLDAPESECAVCDRPSDCSVSVPMFEGDVLPNSWEREWAGFDVCLPCFAVQNLISEPMLAYDLALLAYPEDQSS